ncbi:MAG TPA: ferredoxin--NADP reductase [Myxococcales bacterium]|nr:ferredoxin--NADP reductase [Myxococcales bacterium]
MTVAPGGRMASADKYQGGRITWRRDYGPDLWSVRIAPDSPVSFEPGQYATLGVEDGSKVIERAYSVVSSPTESELEFFFELVPQGQLTPRLYALGPGDRVLLRHRAKGAFRLDRANEHEDHFFVTTVTGIAPVVSIVRTLRKEPAPGVRLVVLQAASRSHELGYQQELEAAEKESRGWLRYIPLVSRPWEDPGWKGEVGRAEDVMRKHLDTSGFHPGTTAVYLCGHPMMIENGKGILLRRGFDREDIHVEVYWMPKKEKAAGP